MIGSYPTVGCLILIDKLSFNGIDDLLQAFRPMISNSYNAVLPVSRGEAVLGGSMHPMLLMVQEVDTMTAVHIEFGEDEVEEIRQATGISVEQLFMPYVQAAKTIPGIIAVGLGFELSPPRDLQGKSLQEAGVAVLFARDEKDKFWSRQETMPLVGHYAQDADFFRRPEFVPYH